MRCFRGLFLPLLLVVLGVVAWPAFQCYQLVNEKQALTTVFGNQTRSFEEATKLRTSLDGLEVDVLICGASFAGLTMRGDLGMSATAFGFAAGTFYWGYFIFEVPSNVIMEKVGARLWIARIVRSGPTTYQRLAGLPMTFWSLQCATSRPG